MQPVLSVEQVRWAEGAAGVSEPVLMQRAAFALATITAQVLRARRGRLTGSRAAALVGTGNNGGDALWAMALLARRGVAAIVVADPRRCHAEGARAARAAGVAVMPWDSSQAASALSGADVVLDGIVGIGASGRLREPAAAVAEQLADRGTAVVAVDLPSGLDPMTGQVSGVAVRATTTVTFGAMKPGLLLGHGRRQCGVLEVADIGLPLPTDPLARVLGLDDLVLARPDALAHKYRRGVVEVVAGSAQYPGAAVLCVGGARAAGVGMVTLDSPDPQVRAAVIGRFPDVVAHPARRPDARVIGPGLGSSGQALERALTDPVPLVVDASALDPLADDAGRSALRRRAEQGWMTILTPHAGEFARLFGPGDDDPLASTVGAADSTGCVVVAKGPGTVVAAPGIAPFIDAFADASLATAGTGDVLSGIIGGLLARRSADRSIDVAAVATDTARAVGLHGMAGQLAARSGGPVSAVEVMAALIPAIATARGAG